MPSAAVSRRTVLATAALLAGGCSLRTLPPDASPSRRIIGLWEQDVGTAARTPARRMRFDADGVFRVDREPPGRWRLDGDTLLLAWSRALDDPWPHDPERWRVVRLDGDVLTLQEPRGGAIRSHHRLVENEGFFGR